MLKITLEKFVKNLPILIYKIKKDKVSRSKNKSIIKIGINEMVEICLNLKILAKVLVL